jgi:hypothetical protein
VESGGSAPQKSLEFGFQVNSLLIALAEHGRFVFGSHRNMK